METIVISKAEFKFFSEKESELPLYTGQHSLLEKPQELRREFLSNPKKTHN